MTDTQSLTLPHARSRVKIRRPKRPSRNTVFWACYCAGCSGLAIWDVLEHDWLLALSALTFLFGAWPCLLGRRQFMDMRVWWLGLAAWGLGAFW